MRSWLVMGDHQQGTNNCQLHIKADNLIYIPAWVKDCLQIQSNDSDGGTPIYCPCKNNSLNIAGPGLPGEKFALQLPSNNWKNGTIIYLTWWSAWQNVAIKQFSCLHVTGGLLEPVSVTYLWPEVLSCPPVLCFVPNSTGVPLIYHSHTMSN